MPELNGFKALSPAQTAAMEIVSEWARSQKTPVPKNVLFKQLINQDMSESTIRKVIYSLVKRGYIRRSLTSSDKAEYVQLRSI